jgi:hypothetical protein
MSNRRARWRAKVRLVAAMASLNPAWTAPEAIELEGATAIIRRASVAEIDRFERMARDARGRGMTVPAIEAWDGNDFGPPAPVAEPVRMAA